MTITYTWREAANFLESNGFEFQTMHYTRVDDETFGISEYHSDDQILFCRATLSNPTFGCVLSGKLTVEESGGRLK